MNVVEEKELRIYNYKKVKYPIRGKINSKLRGKRKEKTESKQAEIFTLEEFDIWKIRGTVLITFGQEISATTVESVLSYLEPYPVR